MTPSEPCPILEGLSICLQSVPAFKLTTHVCRYRIRMAHLTSRCSSSGAAALSPLSLASASVYVSYLSRCTPPFPFLLTSYHAMPVQALRVRYSLMMHFPAFAGSNVEVFD